ncbi:MAG: DUF456 domain-containing protein [Chloroflexi bacterium]|jgi:uncharacterized protein YqgC (DUF456 family)|nr:DUF456 domain-containing protein [Chloroflexota bacterium]
MELAESALIVIALVLMGLSLLLSVIPLLPGPVLMWAIALGFAFLTDFERTPLLVIALMTLLMVAGATSDIWMQAMGVKTQGGSCLTTLGSLAGAVVGSFVIPIPLLGTVIGLVVGALLVEFMRLGQIREAMTAGRVALKLYLLSTVVEFATSAAIMVLFVISLWATD